MQKVKDLIYGKPIEQHPAIVEPDWKMLSSTSLFSVKELKRLYLRYIHICLEDGLVTQARFMYMPEVTSCPFAALAFNHEMEQTQRDHLDFSHFVRILDKLSPKAQPMEKVEYMFDVLQIDFDDRDLLDEKELGLLLKGLTGGMHAPHVLDALTQECWKNLNHERNHEHDMGFDGEPGVENHKGINRAVLTSHLCSLDLQNFITVQF